MHVVVLVTELLLADAGLSQSVHGKEVGNALFALIVFVFDDVCPHHIIFWKQKVSNFILIQLVINFVLLLLGHVQL